MDLERLRRLTEADPERVARQVRDQVREYIELNRRRLQPPPPDPRPAVIAFLGGLILGAIAMWLLDPDEGDERRGRVAQMFRRVGEPLSGGSEEVPKTGTARDSSAPSATTGRPVFSDERSRSTRPSATSASPDAAAGGLRATSDRSPEASTASSGGTSTETVEPATTSPGSERSESA